MPEYRVTLRSTCKRVIPKSLIYVGNFADAVPPKQEFVPFSKKNIRAERWGENGRDFENRMQQMYHEHNLHDILKALAVKELVKYENKTVKLINADIEVNSVATKSDVRSLELDQKEANALKIIEGIVDDKNLVPKYVLEGHLLYGSEKLSNFRMYHIILSLEIKGILKKIKKRDGRYYLLVQD